MASEDMNAITGLVYSIPISLVLWGLIIWMIL